jgi:hypothetical protein
MLPSGLYAIPYKECFNLPSFTNELGSLGFVWLTAPEGDVDEPRDELPDDFLLEDETPTPTPTATAIIMIRPITEPMT